MQERGEGSGAGPQDPRGQDPNGQTGGHDAYGWDDDTSQDPYASPRDPYQRPQQYAPPRDPYQRQPSPQQFEPQPYEPPAGLFREPGLPGSRPQDPYAPQRDPRVTYNDPRVRYDDRDDADPHDRRRPTSEPEPRKSRTGLIASGVVLALIAGGIGVAASGVLKSKKTGTAAATQTSGGSSGTPGSTAPTTPPVTYSDQVPTISDGTNVVQIDHHAVTFPSTVTDAVWSPNGTRLAYIDGDGNVAIADDTGGNVQVLTKAASNAKREHPMWDRNGEIVYSEQDSGGQWLFRTAYIPPAIPPTNAGDPGTWASDQSNKDDNTGYTAATRTNPIGSGAQTIDAWVLGKTVMELDYINEYLDPDSNGYGGYGFTPIATGSEPAIAPGGLVVYVGANGQLFVAAHAEGLDRKTVQITFGADHPQHPTWSPDGTRVAFETTTDVESVAADVKSGATSNPTRQEYDKPGVPTYQNTKASLAALSFGPNDPTSASIEISQGKWLRYNDAMTGGSGIATPNGAVIVSAGSSTALASAATLAAELGDALYITPRGKLDPRIVTELTRLFGKHTTHSFLTYVVGPSAEIPASADAAIASATGTKPTRLSSSDIDIAADYPDAPPAASGPTASRPVVIAAVDDKASLVAALGISATTKNLGNGGYAVPILLTKGSTMPDAAKTFLGAGGDVTAYAIGDEANAAVDAAWAGKPTLKVVKIGASSADGLGPAAANQILGDMSAQGFAASPMTLTILPAGSDANTQVLLATAAQAPVLVSDPASGLGTESLAYAKALAGQLVHVDTIGDPSAFGKQLTTALGSPAPLNVITNPKAAK